MPLYRLLACALLTAGVCFPISAFASSLPYQHREKVSTSAAKYAFTLSNMGAAEEVGFLPEIEGSSTAAGAGHDAEATPASASTALDTTPEYAGLMLLGTGALGTAGVLRRRIA